MRLTLAASRWFSMVIVVSFRTQFHVLRPILLFGTPPDANTHWMQFLHFGVLPIFVVVYAPRAIIQSLLALMVLGTCSAIIS